MPVMQYPVAVWAADPEREWGWTAVCLSEPDLASFGGSRREALEELREYLGELYSRDLGPGAPDLEELQQVAIKVRLQPEYVDAKGKIFPVDSTLELRFPVVTGVHPSGLRSCCVPNLGLQFFFEDGRNLRELVNHYVQDRLAHSTPAQLLRQRPPESVELAQVNVKVSRKPLRAKRVEHPDLTSVAEPLMRTSLRCYGRDELLTDLCERLKARACVLLVGPPGVGKTSLMAEAARRLQKGSEQKEELVWLTSAARLIAGMRFLGEWEERLQRVIGELSELRGILAVESLLELVRQGSEDPTGSIAGFLLPYLQEGELQLVAEATPSELVACRQLLPNLADVFQIVPVPPFAAGPAEQVMGNLLLSLGMRRKLPVYLGAASDLHRLFARFSPYSAFPGNASRYLRQLPGDLKELDRSALLASFSTFTGIPERFLRDETLMDGEEVMLELEDKVLGQTEACRAACRIITTFKAGLQDPTRPLGVLLLCGPTGVGKTELAKTIAEFLFGDKKRLIRLDMSEFSGPAAAERLLGTLHDRQPSTLVRELRRQPFSVVLLDEVEKAHPEVFDVLMRAFDEGCWTDPWGRQTSFHSAVVLMTSNLGSELTRDLGLRRHEAPSFEGAALKFFRPEFLNRLDGVVSFRALSRKTVEEIAAKEIAALSQRPGIRRRQLRLRPTVALLAELVRVGYDERMGARPLQRAVERLVVQPLAKYLARHADQELSQLELGWVNEALDIRPL